MKFLIFGNGIKIEVKCFAYQVDWVYYQRIEGQVIISISDEVGSHIFLDFMEL